eukprot:CAMPEP_0116019462 /NCGR_PEP_ID=MMETSP0321-20121206/9253_1 /TAXON_ID=163516 /ORGANISM="Leptocylindrus danicus var. danicus, Strain B650" /LENGTH=586 /DNA_ID=CAMNT_0003490041 /DNA_START=144 /DNA_END=1904 /DNA_ORIENTATION=-
MNKEKAEAIAKTAAALDLEAYIGRYHDSSETRLQRLLFIAVSAGDAMTELSKAEHKASEGNGINSISADEDGAEHHLAILCKSGYGMALDQMQQLQNVLRYKQIFGAAPSIQDANASLQQRVESLAVASTIGNEQAAGEFGMPEQDAPSASAIISEVASAAPVSLDTAGTNGVMGQNAARHYSIHGIQCDDDWVERTQQQNSLKSEVLESRLDTSKSRLNKESIRAAYLELGNFWKEIGMLKESMRCHLRSRDFCTSSKQSGQMCLAVIGLGIDLRQFSYVNSYVTKAENTVNLVSSEPLTAAKLRVSSGLSLLENGNYADAAKKFTEVSIDLGPEFNSVMSPEDIALYGAVLSLAALDRSEIQKHVIDSSTFKQRLELLPWMRDAIRHFARAEYGEFLSIVGSKKGDMYLDVHLHRHVDKILEQIRDRCLVQYFFPYLSVSLESMGKRFGMNIDKIEDAVASLIEKGKIDARINSRDKTLVAKEVPNHRLETLKKVKCLGDTFMAETHSMILRLSCLDAGLVVQSDANAGSRRGRGYRRGRQRPSLAEDMEVSSDDDNDMMVEYGEMGSSVVLDNPEEEGKVPAM